MENTENTSTSVPVAKSSNKSLWVIIFLLLLVIAGFIAATILVVIPELDKEEKSDNNAETSQQDEDDEIIGEEDIEDDLVMVGFEGDFFSAEAPEDWTIIEYTNGAGTDMTVEGINYTGLTGIEVQNPSGDTIFQLMAVNGIGGASPCSPIYQFTDTDPNYIQDETDYLNEFNASIVSGTLTPLEIEDLSEDYTEFNLFDQRVRRIDHKLYFDNSSSNMYFDPACKLDSAFREIMDIEFGANNDPINDSHTYRHVLSLTASEEDLLILDSILDSMSV